MTSVKYEPMCPTYVPDVIQTRSIGTQYERQPIKKKKSNQWKLTRLYNRALLKHWVNTGKEKKEKKMLRKVLRDIFLDKNLIWTHMKETKLITVLRHIKKEDKDDKEIKKWINGIFKAWKKKFNKRKIKA